MTAAEQRNRRGLFLIGGLGLAAVLAGAFAFWPREEVQRVPSPARGERALGPENAAVTVTEYSDFG